MDGKTQKENWESWLINERHISHEVAAQAGLSINTQLEELQIPVRNRAGETKFSKYRRAPWNTDKPKYRYEFGSEAWLFGMELLDTYAASGDTLLIVTEGELDALVMRSLGYQAVSTTGGAHTWKHAWDKWLEGFDVVLAYDADVAGITGAMKVSQGMPYRIAWLPVAYGKDPTEIVDHKGTESLKQEIKNAHSYGTPAVDAEPAERVIALNRLHDILMRERVQQNSLRMGTPLHRDIALSWVAGQKKAAELAMFDSSTDVVRNPEVSDKIQIARTYPIRKLIKVNGDGFASCVAHAEKSASLKVYPDNHCYCFGCSTRMDAIDVYKALHSCSFNEAVKALAS